MWSFGFVKRNFRVGLSSPFISCSSFLIIYFPLVSWKEFWAFCLSGSNSYHRIVLVIHTLFLIDVLDWSQRQLLVTLFSICFFFINFFQTNFVNWAWSGQSVYGINLMAHNLLQVKKASYKITIYGLIFFL